MIKGSRRYIGSVTTIVTTINMIAVALLDQIVILRESGVLAIRNTVLAQIAGLQMGRRNLEGSIRLAAAPARCISHWATESPCSVGAASPGAFQSPK